MANVPTLQAAAATPNLIQVGPGMLWTNVTKPADGAYLAVSGNLTGAAGQAQFGPMLVTVSGTFVGSTIGESSFSYKPTFVDIKIETALSTVEKVMDQETASCSFNVAELTAENFRDSLPGAAFNQPVATVTTKADDYQAGQTMHIAKIGGLRLVAPQTIAFISANRRINVGGPVFSYVFCGYAAVSTEGYEASFARGSVTMAKIRYELLNDQSRSVGDQLLQFIVRQNS